MEEASNQSPFDATMMEKKLKDYLKYIEALLTEPEEEDPKEQKRQRAERKRVRKEMLVQIGFFQHERLIHLIVTVTFAILAVGSLIASLLLQLAAIYILTVLFLILLVPYIRHYYILENGVQKLYSLYEDMK